MGDLTGEQNSTLELTKVKHDIIVGLLSVNTLDC